MSTSFFPRLTVRAVATLAAFVFLAGCKRDTSPAPSAAAGGAAGASSSSCGSGGTATATGPGAVAVTGNVAAFQDVHITVPWNLSDPAMLTKAATEAAAGRGLRLTEGTTTLEIASDGRSIRLNGRPYGPVKPHDRVVLTKDGKLTVNGVERSAETARATSPAAATSSQPSGQGG